MLRVPTDGPTVPRYVRLADELRQRIIDHEFLPGSALPSTSDLARSASVSQTTVMQALRLLRAEGLIDMQHGRGTFVRLSPPKILRRASHRYPIEKLNAKRTEYERRTAEMASGDFGRPSSTIGFTVEFDQIEAPPDLAETFGVATATSLLRRRYIWSDPPTGAQLTITTSYLLHAVAATNPDLLRADLEPWPGGTQHQLSTIGIEVAQIVDRITARLPQFQERQLLQLAEGTAVVIIRKISIDTDGNVVEVSDIVLPADRTELEYVIDLPRWTK
jgi:GntR family transcriptional regulator